jgi:pimeloyl-ACP methyl ester carboxylesterase
LLLDGDQWDKQRDIAPGQTHAPNLYSYGGTMSAQRPIPIISHCGHFANLEQPSEFNAILREFIAPLLKGDFNGRNA